MLASPAPVRAFVCVIRKNMGLNLKYCLGNDARKTLLYAVDISLNNQFAFSDKTTFRGIASVLLKHPALLSKCNSVVDSANLYSFT